MKKILIILVFLLGKNAYSQTNTIDLYEGSSMNSPAGTYIKDINNVFAPYLGTWKYQNGNNILTIKLEKVTKFYSMKFKTYHDFIKGNYSYSTDGGNTYLINTIQTNTNNNTPEGNSIYSCDPNATWIENFILKDVLFNKSCFASIRFVPNSLNQLELKLKDIKNITIEGDAPVIDGFSIPNNIVLIKQ